jgi:hypothetical protein
VKFVRLATFSFQDARDQWKSWVMEAGKIKVQTHGSWRKEKTLKLLASATLQLKGYPGLTDDNLVMIPDDVRSQAELALETAANLISIIEHCQRSISSPTPCVALVPESAMDREWLGQRLGIELRKVATAGARVSLDLGVVQTLVADRLDGVFLLAEALAHEHATGRFHDLNRFFERAFARSGTHLVRGLFKFLRDANQGFTKVEVKEWVFDIRHPATHADREGHFLLESDVRPVVGRMEQAAYDVLFNKEVWRDSSANRREGIRLTSGTTSARSADMFVVRGTEMTMRVQLLDPFGRYPMDLEGFLEKPPADWWCPDPRAAKSESGKVSLSVAGGQFEVRES